LIPLIGLLIVYKLFEELIKSLDKRLKFFENDEKLNDILKNHIIKIND